VSFSWRRAGAVFQKDFLDLRKNRALLWSMMALPGVMVVIPALMVLAYVHRPDDPNLRVMAQYYDVTVNGDHAVRFLIDKVLIDWFSVYLIMPVFVPILVSSHSVAGEKEHRTLEPLLASPVTPVELLIGKSLASLVPSFLICVIAFLGLCCSIDLVTFQVVHELLLPNAMWIFGVFVIAPLFAFFGNGIAVVISARVGDARLAQQMSGLFVLPLVGLAGGQFAGWLKAGVGYYAALGAFVLLLDVGIVLASRRLFDRERMMSRAG
jgi:ABC-2 type transport system permease protein